MSPESCITQVSGSSGIVPTGETSASEKIIDRSVATSKSDIEENVEVLSLSIRNESSTVKEANAPDHPQVSTLIPENQISKESDVPSEVSPVSEHDSEVPQYSLVHSAPSYPALLLPQVRIGQFPPFESNESQSREATRFPSIVPIKEAAAAAAHGNIPPNNEDRLVLSCLYLLLARMVLQGSIPSDMVDPYYYMYLEFKEQEKRKKKIEQLIINYFEAQEQKEKKEQGEEESSTTEESIPDDDDDDDDAGPPYQSCDFEPDEYWF